LRENIPIRALFQKSALEFAFGFSDTESSIMVRLFNNIFDKTSKGNGAIHQFVKMLASVVYNDSKWQTLSGFYSEKQVLEYLKKFGLSEDDISVLFSAVEEQYSLAPGSITQVEDYIIKIELRLGRKLCADEKEQYESYFDRFSGKSDFAHMLATMEAYLNGVSPLGSLITGATNGVYSKAKNLGYAGDIYGVGGVSPSMGPDDYMADLDAVNLAMLSRKTGDLFNVWGDYFAGIEGETINRASEFAKNPGNGNLEKGQKN